MPRHPWLRPMLLATAILFSVGVLSPGVALAKDGGGNGGHGGDDHGDDHGGGDDDGGRGGRGDDKNDDDGGGGGGPGRGRGRGGDDWDNSGSTEARAVVSRGTALPLDRVIPVVRQAVPGRVLDVDLQQWTTGGWVYKFLVLSSDGEYTEVFVDALRNRIVRVRER